MADLSGVTTNFFPVASETYTNNINATIAALAATVPVNAATAYTDGDIVVLTVDPGTANQATFTGVKASAPDRFVTCKWTEGNVGVGHANGAVITDYDSATHYDLVTKGVRTFANPDGSLKSLVVQNALNLGAGTLNGWNALAYTFNSVTYLGNRSYSCVTNTQDLTPTLSAGFRLRSTRTVAAGTQSTSLDGVAKYWSKTAPNGMTFTGAYSAFGWIKLNAYGGTQNIISRDDGTNGWEFAINPSGQLESFFRSGAGFSSTNSFQSLPLNKMVHVAVVVTAATRSFQFYIDGVAVPTTAGSGSITTISQGGILQIGANNGTGNFLNGKIAQAGVASRVLTLAEVQSIYSQGITSTQVTALQIVSAYSFDGNATDLNTTNNNSLTATAAAGFTTDAPWTVQANGTPNGTQDYGILQSIAYTGGNTVSIIQMAEGCTIPTIGGVNAVAYSSVKVPYGFPGQRDKWILDLLILSTIAGSSVATGVFNTFGGLYFSTPVGSWSLATDFTYQVSPSGAGVDVFTGISLSNTGQTSQTLSTRNYLTGISAGATYFFQNRLNINISLSSITLYYPFLFTNVGFSVAPNLRGITGIANQNEYSKMTAENAYL